MQAPNAEDKRSLCRHNFLSHIAVIMAHLIVFLIIFCLQHCCTAAAKPFGFKSHTMLKKTMATTASIAASSLFLLTSTPAHSLAAEAKPVTTANIYDYVSSTSEEDRTERKTRLLKDAQRRDDETLSSKSDGDRYKASLAKEQGATE